MNTDEPFSVSIQTEAAPIPSVPAWFGEVALVAHVNTSRIRMDDRQAGVVGN